MDKTSKTEISKSPGLQEWYGSSRINFEWSSTKSRSSWLMPHSSFSYSSWRSQRPSLRIVVLSRRICCHVMEMWGEKNSKKRRQATSNRSGLVFSRSRTVTWRSRCSNRIILKTQRHYKIALCMIRGCFEDICWTLWQKYQFKKLLKPTTMPSTHQALSISGSEVTMILGGISKTFRVIHIIQS